jgi:oligopeptide transport system substrate-binding protein
MRRIASLAAIAALVASIGLVLPARVEHERAGGARADVRIAGVPLASLDPAASGDVATGAILANLYEGLTALDANLAVRPALARSWDADPAWTHIVFHLREGLTFSDGTRLGAEDVVRSWLRLLDPQHPSPLAGLLSDVSGAPEYLAGTNKDPASVGLTALSNSVDVRLRHSAPWFVAATASPDLAVVPRGFDPASGPGSAFKGSGAYAISSAAGGGATLTANPHYWAGTPSIANVTVVADPGQGGTIGGFRSGTLDYTDLADVEARWIRYDATLGPALREEPPMTVELYGFDTTKPPFDDARVRQAFAMAVDWRTIAAASDSTTPATSLVPPGVPGRSTADLIPRHDPDEARRLLAAAGYPGGSGFPTIALQSGGSTFDDAVRDALVRELHVPVHIELLQDFLERMLGTDRPAMWSLAWIADYPDPYDFLGVLLGRGQTSNFGRWSNADFDAALDRAATASTASDRTTAYEAAERVVADQAPVIPVAYPRQWALAREGLLGATTGGTGILRYGGLAWAP